MKTIDLSAWQEVKLKDIFLMKNTKSVVQKDIVPDSGKIPYVTAQAGNNGVLTYVDCPDEWIDDGNCIMIGGKTLAFSYQKEPFCSNDSHNIALYLQDKSQATENHYLFLISALRASLYQKYTWSDSISMKRIWNESFTIPVDSDGNPDWYYMDSYMSKAIQNVEASLNMFEQADNKKRNIDVSSWKKFAIGDIFEVVKGTRLTKAQMIPGNTRFIGSSAMNNGCTALIGNTENMHPGNTITVCYNGSVGETFYQDEPFLASDDVNVLYPRFDMTCEIALFIIPLIKAVSTRYNYVDKWKQETMTSDEIMLPVTESGQPDWEYMDGYMTQITENMKENLSTLEQVV